MLNDALMIAFWTTVVGAPLLMFIRHQSSWPDKGAALLRWVPLPIALTAVFSVLSFLMSGATGFISMLLLMGMSSTAITLILATASLNKPRQ
ncbi:MAG: hypothetical protein SH850_18705 [Planctomycetaceae bacterium]|nr:hypothetical protein [Planctomycetaceae bacterium]